MDKRKRPFNDYETLGDLTKIYIKRKNEGILTTLIDTEDLDKLKAFNSPVQWVWSNTSNSYYARIYKYGKPKYLSLYIHRFIVNAEDGMHVDHINHDTLDNRKCNLRVIELKQNNKHRKSKNSNNKSGYRNVCWIGGYINKWVVQLMVDGKNTRLGFFDDLEEAADFAEEMRQKYYGEFAGCS